MFLSRVFMKILPTLALISVSFSHFKILRNTSTLNGPDPPSRWDLSCAMKFVTDHSQIIRRPLICSTFDWNIIPKIWKKIKFFSLVSIPWSSSIPDLNFVGDICNFELNFHWKVMFKILYKPTIWISPHPPQNNIKCENVVEALYKRRQFYYYFNIINMSVSLTTINHGLK